VSSSKEVLASSAFPAFSCTSFKASGLILRSSIHFELILIQNDEHGSSFSFLQAATFVEETVFSPLHVFGTFVKNWVGVVIISVSVPVLCCFYCYAPVV
jgi:hypothetical protein